MNKFVLAEEKRGKTQPNYSFLSQHLKESTWTKMEMTLFVPDFSFFFGGGGQIRVPR